MGVKTAIETEHNLSPCDSPLGKYELKLVSAEKRRLQAAAATAASPDAKVQIYVYSNSKLE